MRKIHVLLESVQSELLKKDQSDHPHLWKAPNYDVHQIWPSRKPVSNYILKKQWLRLSLRTIEYATNTYKKYFYTFRINQVIFTYGEKKKQRPNFYGMFSQNVAFTAILKMKLPWCNVIGVCTPPDWRGYRQGFAVHWKTTCSLLGLCSWPRAKYLHVTDELLSVTPSSKSNDSPVS